MQKDKIKIEFENGKKILICLDGTVKEYTKNDLERHKSFLIGQKERLDRHIAYVDQDLAKIEQGRTL